MTFDEFCDFCNLEIVVKRQPGAGNPWIARITGNEVFQGAGNDPDGAIYELSKSISGVSFKHFPQALDYAVVPKFEGQREF